MESLRFKYKDLSDQGQPVGMFSKKGEITGEEIVFAGTRMPLLAVLQTAVRLDRLILVIYSDPKPLTVAIAITSGGHSRALQLKQAIDCVCSGYWADRRKQELEKAGKGGQYRTEACPYCRATVDLTGFAPSPQLYCPYCGVLATVVPGGPADEQKFRLCDMCGFYSRPGAFTSLYIVYLLFAAFWQRRTTTLCNACMRSEAWKMVGGNLLGLIGEPVALCQLGRAYLGGATFSASFAGLDTANHAARKKKFARAEELYSKVLDRMTNAAGVHYNRALLRWTGGDWQGCLEEVEATWTDCSNYRPALALAYEALNRLGRAAEAEALKIRWEG